MEFNLKHQAIQPSHNPCHAYQIDRIMLAVKNELAKSRVLAFVLSCGEHKFLTLNLLKIVN